MLRYCLALLAGAYALQFFPALPPQGLRWPAVVLALAAAVPRRTRIAALFLLGFCMAWRAAAVVIDDRLPAAREGTTVRITGTVADFPARRAGSSRFLLDLQGAPELPARVRLTWYEASASPRIGETWALHVRLRRPRGFANPIAFDYEQWLFRQRIGATGYVVAHPANRRLDDRPVSTTSRIRGRIADRIVAVTGPGDAAAVLQAIVVGARHDITARQWDRYAATGTSHLMAISGLHIGLAAGGAWILARLLVAPFCRWQNVRDLAGLAALASAAAYACLSGFAIPAQRALVMVLAVIAAALLRRQGTPGHALALAGIAVFLGDPLSILAAGFKLSFAAVAILLWSARQRAGGDGADGGTSRLPAELFCRLPPLQLVLMFGLMPLTVALFGRVAWLAPLVNLLVLPLFNLVTVPAALLGALLDGPFAPAGDALLRTSWYSVRSALALIAWVADWPATHLHVATSGRLVLAAATLAALWAVLPPGWPGRGLAWIAALGVTALRPAPPPTSCVDITTLDVGQGLAMVLQTRHRVLVFDTGPAFRSGGDAGDLVLVPYLRAAGIDLVDLLMISHADSDHAGGARSLAAAVAVRRLASGGEIGRLVAAQHRCRTGQSWTWDGVRFSVLHPDGVRATNDNDRSCVLEVATGSYRALLTGDIEGPAESRLLASGLLADVEVALVPHHGSRTSSSPAFVRRLGPQLAIVSAGFGNRWGLPKADVVQRWQRGGARVLDTATSGAIRIRMCRDSGIVDVAEHRLAARKYWHDDRR